MPGLTSFMRDLPLNRFKLLSQPDSPSASFPNLLAKAIPSADHVAGAVVISGRQNLHARHQLEARQLVGIVMRLQKLDDPIAKLVVAVALLFQHNRALTNHHTRPPRGIRLEPGEFRSTWETRRRLNRAVRICGPLTRYSCGKNQQLPQLSRASRSQARA